MVKVGDGMELKKIICPICGSNNFIEIKDIYKCKACDTQFEKIQDNSKEKIELYSSLYIAESFIRMTPPRFDLAEEQYKIATNDFPQEAVAWWGLFRAKNNIKYINGIPICYEYNDMNLKEDNSYLNALRYADEYLSNRIKNEIERIIVNIQGWKNRAKELDYDVFLSFKHKDEFGNETEDTSIVKDLYIFLISKGLKVFFSPETMKEHIGEPVFDAYIYNALAKSKVLFVYGSKPEYFESDWVMSEWTRYLNMISLGKKNLNSLLISYKNFNAYDLPRDLKNIQAYDSSNGLMNDIIYSKIHELIGNKVKKLELKEKNIDSNIVATKNKENDVIIINEEIVKAEIYAHNRYINGYEFSQYDFDCKEIVLGNNVKIIGDFTFNKLNIEKIVIPDSVEEIGDYAFSSCSHLKEVVLGRGLKKIGIHAFAGCGLLKKIEIPDGITKIESGTFQKCTSLKSITISNSVIEICDFAFAECSSLQSIIIPDGVRKIGYKAFEFCSKLEEVYIGDDVFEIDSKPFFCCEALKKISARKTIENLVRNSIKYEKHHINLELRILQSEIDKNDFYKKMALFFMVISPFISLIAFFSGINNWIAGYIMLFLAFVSYFTSIIFRAFIKCYYKGDEFYTEYKMFLIAVALDIGAILAAVFGWIALLY